MGFLLYYAFGRNQTVLAVLAFGYGSIQQAMTDGAAMSAWGLLAIALGKILTTSLTIGSGGSGGVFGPSMVIGGCGGGALMRTDVTPLAPEDRLDRALELFIEHDLLSLPVVDDLRRRKVLGMIRRQEIGSAYVRHVHGPLTPSEQDSRVT